MAGERERKFKEPERITNCNTDWGEKDAVSITFGDADAASEDAN